MTKQAGLICLVLVAGLTIAGCCTPEKCERLHGLIECTKEQCEQKYPPVLPPDGPDIVLGPGLSKSLVWTIDGSAATDGGTLFDSGNPDTYCKLREDFVGTDMIHFKYTRLGQTTPQVAQDMIVKSGDIELKFKIGSGDTMDWWIKNHATGKACTLRKGDIPATITDVPSEFLGFTTGQTGDVFREEEDAQDAKQAEIKVEY
jgi:hypothetical protein